MDNELDTPLVESGTFFFESMALYTLNDTFDSHGDNIGQESVIEWLEDQELDTLPAQACTVPVELDTLPLESGISFLAHTKRYTLRETAYCDGDNTMQLTRNHCRLNCMNLLSCAELLIQTINADTLLYINYCYIENCKSLRALHKIYILRVFGFFQTNIEIASLLL